MTEPGRRLAKSAIQREGNARLNSPAIEPPALRYPYDEAPPAGTVTEIAPGVRWLRMPLPFALNHINLWLLEDGPGWTVVDTGLDMPNTREIWEEIFATALDGKPITRVLVTHFHPDHLGLAGWLARRWNAPLWISEREWLYGRRHSLDTDDAAYIAEYLPFFRRAGVAAEALGIMAERGNSFTKRVSAIPRSFHRIGDGDEIAIGGRSWRVVTGRGHAPEQSCLLCPELNLFIAGDQVLPRISPNVSCWPNEPDADPLTQFLDSLATLRRVVPPETLILPSHGLPFYGVQTRIDQLAAHHAARLADLEAACAEPQSTMEILPVLFRRKLDAQQLGFAVGEAVAHLNHLLAKNRLSRVEGEDGIYRYRRV
jgi:glyoxylase-like metal-dependent hydrolase (beta-lactamase superfamily II)